jgi:hypothetical protein
MPTHPLADDFRATAKKLAASGAADIARVWELAAERADAYFRAHALEELTLARASVESGYSISQISRLLSSGAIQNVGKKGAPRVTRGSLPKKPQTFRAGASTHEEPDLVGRAFRQRG